MTTTSPATEMAALDAVAQAELVRRGEVTAAELVGWAIERIEDLNPILNAVITPMYDQALAAAAMTPSAGLAGVPYLVKDLIAEVAGVPFSGGSRFLRGHVSPFDSELVLRLRRAGLVIVGKTNTPEFGMAPTCEPVLHGPTRNPWDTTRSTSGSSGGSAAAVAARMVPMAHGNDLGGSIRYPASACGLFGLKPTRARNPLGPEYGDAVNGWACEHALTRTVRDSAVLLDATAGPGLGDPYGPPAPVRPFADEIGRDPGRLRIGYTAITPEGAPRPPRLRDRTRRRGRALRIAGPRTGRSRPARTHPRGRSGDRVNLLCRHGLDHQVLDPPPRPPARPRRTRAADLRLLGDGPESVSCRLSAGHRGLPSFHPPCRAVPHQHRPLAHTHHVNPARTDRRDHLDRGRAAAGPRTWWSHGRLPGCRRQHHG